MFRSNENVYDNRKRVLIPDMYTFISSPFLLVTRREKDDVHVLSTLPSLR